MNRSNRLVFCMVILGIALIGMAFTGLSDNAKSALPFESLKESQLKNGNMVEGEVPVNLGCFAAMYRTGFIIKSSTSDYYYVVFVEDKAIGLKCSGKTHEALREQANAYLDHINDNELVLDKVPIKGKIQLMDNEIKGYLEKYLSDEESNTRSIEIMPYVISTGLLTTWQSILMIVLGAALIIIPLLMVMSSLRNDRCS